MHELADILIESIVESGALEWFIAIPSAPFLLLLLCVLHFSFYSNFIENKGTPGYENSGCGGGGPGIIS